MIPRRNLSTLWVSHRPTYSELEYDNGLESIKKNVLVRSTRESKFVSQFLPSSSSGEKGKGVDISFRRKSGISEQRIRSWKFNGVKTLWSIVSIVLLAIVNENTLTRSLDSSLRGWVLCSLNSDIPLSMHLYLYKKPRRRSIGEGGTQQWEVSRVGKMKQEENNMKTAREETRNDAWWRTKRRYCRNCEHTETLHSLGRSWLRQHGIIDEYWKITSRLDDDEFKKLKAYKMRDKCFALRCCGTERDENPLKIRRFRLGPARALQLIETKSAEWLGLRSIANSFPGRQGSSRRRCSPYAWQRLSEDDATWGRAFELERQQRQQQQQQRR